MLRHFRNLPLRHKLMVLTMAISGVALLLASVGFALSEQAAFRRAMARDTAILADMFDDNVAAGLAFNDPASIERTLQTLGASPHIVAACVYDKQGAVIGAYHRPGAAAGGAFAFPAAQPTNQHFSPDRLDTFQDITLAGEVIGVVYIGLELTELRERVWRYVGFVSLLLGACLLVAWGLAAWLQRLISQPILDLAQTVATVSAEKNYAVRAPKQSDDELGRLIDGFNEMLAQIQQRDAALQGARDQLEARVTARTRELQFENTRRRNAESSLRLLNTAVEQAKESVLITDAQLNLPGPRIVFVNPAFTQMTGYTADEVIGLTPRILHGPRTSRSVLDRLRKNLEQGDVFSGEAINYRKGGEEFTLEWQVAPLRDANATITHFVAIQRDITARKQTELALQESEERYRSLIENASDAIFTIAADGTFTSLNRAVENIAGLVRGAWLGRPFTEMVHPADLPVAREMFDRIMAGDLTPVHELRSHPGLPWAAVMEMTLSAQKNPAGKIVGVLGIGRDITKRKEVEAARDRLAEMLEATTDLVSISDPAGHLTYLNRAGRLRLGVGPAEDITAFAVADFLHHPASHVILTEGIPTAVREGSWTGETVLRSHGGQEFPVSQVILSHKGSDGKLEFLSTIMRDITEPKRVEEALQRQQAELRILFDLMPALVWFKDTKNGILRVNQRVAENAGKSVEEIEGKSSAEIYPEEAARFYQDDLEVINSGAPKLNYVEALRDKGGQEHWVQTDKVPVRDQAGAVTGIIVMSQDITERIRAEGELQKVHRELVEASRQAGMAEVATGVLHNVGNVLNSVNVSATIVSDQVRQTEARKITKLAALFAEHQADLAVFLTSDPRGRLVPGYLGTLAAALAAEHQLILSELDQLRKNIDHIKEIVAVQQSNAQASGIVETVTVTEIVDDALRLNQASFRQDGIETIRDYQAQPTVSTDKHKVMQILINLVRNAKYACDDSGRSDKQITLRTRSDEHALTIAVTDNGVGIPTENLTRIFSHGFTTRKGGHGFGLHSGALAAKELGGSLGVQSAGLGHGATFTLELPCHPDPPAQ